MNYEEWEKVVPETITGDSLWKMKAYRLALFVADMGWHDVTKLMQDRRTIGLSDQLYRALGSVGANLAEGYSRGTGRDRARFYEYSLGSARESRDWYFKGRHVLGETITPHRLQLLTEIIRLLLTMIPKQRGRILREDDVPYHTDGSTVSRATLAEVLNIAQLNATIPWAELNPLLQNVPLPTP